MKYFNNGINSYQEIDPPVRRRGLGRLVANFVTGTVIIGTLVAVVLTLVFKSSASNEDELLQKTVDRWTSESHAPFSFPSAELEQGLIIGKEMNSRAGRAYFAFLGIPYAKPPLGDLRFEPPVTADDVWNGTLHAREFKRQCIQKDKKNEEIIVIGDEDCLYLNVFTPKLTKSDTNSAERLFPVLVYIHGGGQYGTASKYGADYFMDEDVVLVTINYRLGVMGNLNTNDTNARGNQGHKDQVMALKWIKNNILNFGGDNGKVTIFGNSGGGMHVSAHLLSSMSAGLIQRTISQSGVEISPEIFTQYPLKVAFDLGTVLNCSGSGTKELVTCFRDTSAKDLILNSYTMDFATSVEPPSDSDDVFLSDMPLKLLQNKQINRVPAVFGVTASEGLHFSLPILTSPNLTEAFNKNWAPMAGETLWLNTSATLQDPDRIANAARDFYLGTKNLSRDVETNFTQMFTDRRNIHPASVFAAFQLAENSIELKNVYLYYFNQPVEVSYADSKLKKYGVEESLGPAHGDELQFLFPHDPFPFIPVGSKDANFSQMMVRLWVSFADTGEPTGALNEARWLPMTQEKPYKWFELSKEPKMTSVVSDRMNFWDSFDVTDLYV